METPLFDKSGVRVAGIHTSGLCGVHTSVGAGWGRDGLSTWAESVRRKENTR